MEQSTPKDTTDEALRRLEARLERASDAAERLFSEAASEATSAAIRMGERLGARRVPGARPRAQGEQPRAQGEQPRAQGEQPRAQGEQPRAQGDPPRAEGPPAQGWQIPAEEEPRTARSELEVLLAAWESVRELVPPELRHRLGEAIKEVLLAVRALIDWYLERLEQRAAQPVAVQDIPVL